MSEFDNIITLEEVKAFSNYCMDVSATLKDYGFTLERAAEVAREIATNFYLYEGALNSHMSELPESPEHIPEDSYTAKRMSQDMERIERNRKRRGYTLTRQIAQEMFNKTDILREEDAARIKLAFLEESARYMDYTRDCPMHDLLDRYVKNDLDPKKESEDIERIDRHLAECDSCAYTADRIEEDAALKSSVLEEAMKIISEPIEPESG